MDPPLAALLTAALVIGSIYVGKLYEYKTHNLENLPESKRNFMKRYTCLPFPIAEAYALYKVSRR